MANMVFTDSYLIGEAEETQPDGWKANDPDSSLVLTCGLDMIQ
jgi:hypothetical protein